MEQREILVRNWMHLQQRVQNRITLAVAVFAVTVTAIAIVVGAYFVLAAENVEGTATLEAAQI